MGELNLVQLLIDVVFGVAAFMGAFVVNAMWAAIKDLQKADTTLADKVSHIETLVAGDYVKRSDFDRHITQLYSRFDRIGVQLEQIKVALVNKKDKHDND